MRKQSTLKRLSSNKNLSLVVIMAVIIVFFEIMNPGYLGKSNILILLKSTSLTGIIGVGVGCLLISGQVDLGAGAEAGLGGVLAALLLQAGMPWPLAAIIAIIFGMVAGAINAFLANGLNMMAFIATIGMSSVWQGVGYVLTRANAVKFSNEAFIKIGATSILWGYIPLSYIIMVALMVIYGVILAKTKFGRSMYMCGGNRDAARLAGINPKRVTTLLFINCGAISALGGVLLTSNMRKGDPTPLTLGMDSITAAVLGGVSFMGGSGGMGGLFIGLMLLNTFNNGLTVIQLRAYWQIFAQGALLIIALAVDFYRERSRLRALKASKNAALAAKQS
jgi:ribose transport system permease protein